MINELRILYESANSAARHLFGFRILFVIRFYFFNYYYFSTYMYFIPYSYFREPIRYS